MKLTEKEKNLIDSILFKKDQLEKSGYLLAIIDFDTINGSLTADEIEVATKIKETDPKNYGFKGPYLGLSPVPKDLVKIENQKYKFNEEEHSVSTQFAPQKTYDAYVHMNKKMQAEIDRTVLIESGYRSPACQMLVFLYYLKQHNWDFSETIKRVALPGYSEHGYPSKQALDFITADGIPNDENPQKFADTKEYEWLTQNASQFKFFLSYPQNNPLGIMFEPWHWSFQID